MPQFDFYSFVSQTFWLLITFSIFFYFFLYFYIAKNSEVIKLRQKLTIRYLEENHSNLQLYDKYISRFFLSKFLYKLG